MHAPSPLNHLQLLTLFSGLGSVLGSKEVAEKAITAYAEKRENVGKWFEEAVTEGNVLMDVFQKSSIDQGEPAKRVQRELDGLREEKDRVDQLWLDAQEAQTKKMAKKERVNKTRRKSNENKPVIAPVPMATTTRTTIPTTRPETEGKEATNPPLTSTVEPPPVTSSERPSVTITSSSGSSSPRVAQTQSSSVEEGGKDRVKVLRTPTSETVSRWLTDEYAELEDEAYKVHVL